MGQSDTASEMAALVCMTLENDQVSNKRVAGIVKAVVEGSKRWPEGYRTDHRVDATIGRDISVWLGERLDAPSPAKHNVLRPNDGPVALVWMTLINHVAWPEVGKYFREAWSDDLEEEESRPPAPAGWHASEDTTEKYISGSD